MVQALGAGTRAARWGRVALVALALQAWSAWLLLRVWVITEAAGPVPLLGRIRTLPAHPDWVLAALAQSVVTALVLVGVAGHWRPVWALIAAPVAGGIAWAVVFGWLPGGLGEPPTNVNAVVMLVIQALQQILAPALVLVAVALAWRLLGRWFAVPVVAVVGGSAAGAIRLVLTDSFWGVPWHEGWPREIVGDVVGVGLLAVVVALLRGTKAAVPDGPPAPSGRRSGAVVGTLGLLALTAAHLAGGWAFSGWIVADSWRLLAAGGLLAVLAAVALFVSRRVPAPALPPG